MNYPKPKTIIEAHAIKTYLAVPNYSVKIKPIGIPTEIKEFLGSAIGVFSIVAAAWVLYSRVKNK